ncbi:hypothetical protein LMO53_15385 [Escherichia coli]|uniref:hypothetical protein n=1 Tax=Escherichia coli TaxID=562 RepID=UPI001E31BFC0|nr:hypothetical protein [Escherichia coli]MCC5125548.1 hypothetical protein [Escherichia coli]
MKTITYLSDTGCLEIQGASLESVLLFDAKGEGWLIGWRSLWYTWGQKETGEWQWTFQVGDLENVNITHWAVMPKAPEAGA